MQLKQKNDKAILIALLGNIPLSIHSFETGTLSKAEREYAVQQLEESRNLLLAELISTYPYLSLMRISNGIGRKSKKLKANFKNHSSIAPGNWLTLKNIYE